MMLIDGNIEKQHKRKIYIFFFLGFIIYFIIKNFLYCYYNIKDSFFTAVISDLIVCLSVLIGLIISGAFSFYPSSLAIKFYNQEIIVNRTTTTTTLHQISSYLLLCIKLGILNIIILVLVKLFNSLEIDSYFITLIAESFCFGLLCCFFLSFIYAVIIIFKIFTNNRNTD
jgi:hypothetical protein